MNGSLCSNYSIKTIILIFPHTWPGSYLLSRPDSGCNQFVFAFGTQHPLKISPLVLLWCYMYRSSVGYRRFGTSKRYHFQGAAWNLKFGTLGLPETSPRSTCPKEREGLVISIPLGRSNTSAFSIFSASFRRIEINFWCVYPLHAPTHHKVTWRRCSCSSIR